MLFVGDHFGIGAYKNNVVVANGLYLFCMGAYYVIVISQSARYAYFNFRVFNFCLSGWCPADEIFLTGKFPIFGSMRLKYVLTTPAKQVQKASRGVICSKWWPKG